MGWGEECDEREREGMLMKLDALMKRAFERGVKNKTELQTVKTTQASRISIRLAYEKLTHTWSLVLEVYSLE